MPIYFSEWWAPSEWFKKRAWSQGEISNWELSYATKLGIGTGETYQPHLTGIYNLNWLQQKIGKNFEGGGRDSSVGKSSTYQSRDLGLNPGGGLTRVTQCMNERRRDCQL